MDETNVQVIFTKVDDVTGLKFTDAIYFPISQFNSITPEQLESIKQARFDAWLEIIRNPPGDDNG